jgi:hypothetical protein
MAEDKKVLSKRNLYLVQVQEVKPYGNKTPQRILLPVMAKDLSLAKGDPLADKSLRFVAFQTSLQDFIKGLKPNDIFTADYEEIPRPETEYGPDRNIVQVYKADGTPVLVQGGKSGGGMGRSSESIRLEYSFKAQIEAAERISVEGQTAINQVGEWLRDPNWRGLDNEAKERILEKYWQAVEKSLDAFLAAKPIVLKETPEPATRSANAPVKSQDAKITAVTDVKVSKTPPPTWTPLKNVGELLTRAAKFNVMKADVMIILSVKNTTEIKDLDGSWNIIAASKKLSPPTEPADPNDPDGLFRK